METMLPGALLQYAPLPVAQLRSNALGEAQRAMSQRLDWTAGPREKKWPHRLFAQRAGVAAGCAPSGSGRGLLWALRVTRRGAMLAAAKDPHGSRSVSPVFS